VLGMRLRCCCPTLVCQTPAGACVSVSEVTQCDNNGFSAIARASNQSCSVFCPTAFEKHGQSSMLFSYTLSRLSFCWHRLRLFTMISLLYTKNGAPENHIRPLGTVTGCGPLRHSPSNRDRVSRF
jgi:hypothetical protein